MSLVLWLRRKDQRHNVCFEKLHFKDLNSGLLWLAHFPMSFLSQPAHSLLSSLKLSDPPVVSSSVIDSYPFHLVFNYTPTPQFTCPKLLQRKPTHTQKVPNTALPVLHEQRRVWIESLGPNPDAWRLILALCVTQDSFCNCVFMFEYTAGVI